MIFVPQTLCGITDFLLSQNVYKLVILQSFDP
jgi:hypothetical protein